MQLSLANRTDNLLIYYIEDGVAMAIRPRILFVGDDITLLQTRELIFGDRFEVLISARLSEAFNLALKQPFKLIVVFSETESWREFAEFIARESPKTIILAITRNGESKPGWADEVVPSTKGSLELLRVCAQRFGITMRSKSHKLLE